MATTALTLSAERWLDEVILVGAVADVGAATLQESFTLPSGLGDIAVMSSIVSIVSIATVPVAATIDRGFRLVLVSPDATSIVDVLGIGQWFATSGDGAAFTRVDGIVDPDALMLWRQTDVLSLTSPEMDAGATGDLRIIIKAVRVRPIEAPMGQGPIQLVRSL